MTHPSHSLVSPTWLSEPRNGVCLHQGDGDRRSDSHPVCVSVITHFSALLRNVCSAINGARGKSSTFISSMQSRTPRRTCFVPSSYALAQGAYENIRIHRFLRWQGDPSFKIPSNHPGILIVVFNNDDQTGAQTILIPLLPILPMPIFPQF